MEKQEEIEFENPIKKVKDVEKEREKILSSVSSFSSDNINSKVALILNNFPDTRDSDFKLQIKYWEIFQPDLVNGKTIHLDNYPKLERLNTIVRARAFIQNTCGLFEASPEVKEHRGLLADDEKEKIKKEKPDYPVISIFADESGKNDKTLIVGSIWFLHESSANELIQRIFTWRNTNDIKNEFHFRNINDKNLQTYKKLVEILIAHSSAVGFRAITVERAGISHVQDAFIKLYSQLILKGIEFENKSGRAKLPRYIQFIKDKEEDGFDKLLLSEVRERLESSSKLHFNGELLIDFLRADDSKQQPFLQLADLFASSINRIYNQVGNSFSAKDDFAQYFLNAFGVTMNLSQVYKESDISFHISL